MEAHTQLVVGCMKVVRKYWATRTVSKLRLGSALMAVVLMAEVVVWLSGHTV